MLVGHSTEPARAYWNGKIANEWDIGNETCPDNKTQACAKWQKCNGL